jgi:Flp pilus assembly protein TadG
MRLIRIFRCAEKGSVAVEAAITLSGLLFVLLGGVQFGLAYLAWNTMLLAAEEAGRYAMLYNACAVSAQPCPPGCSGSTSALADCAVAWANQNFGNIFPVTPDIADPNCPSGMSFTASYTFNIVTPISLTRYLCVIPTAMKPIIGHLRERV